MLLASACSLQYTTIAQLLCDTFPVIAIWPRHCNLAGIVGDMTSYIPVEAKGRQKRAVSIWVHPVPFMFFCFFAFASCLKINNKIKQTILTPTFLFSLFGCTSFSKHLPNCEFALYVSVLRRFSLNCHLKTLLAVRLILWIWFNAASVRTKARRTATDRQNRATSIHVSLNQQIDLPESVM